MTAALVALLLILAALTNLGPELVAGLTGGSVRAWEYVAQGAQAAALWLMVMALLLPYPRARLPAVAICAYGAAEAALRPACRLSFPMDRPPSVPAPEGLCAAAGWPWWYAVSPLALALSAVALAHIAKGRT